MKALLKHRTTRHVLFWLTVEVVDILVQLPAHFVHGMPLYLWGLVLVQLPACLLCIYPLVYGLLPRLLQRQPRAWGWLLLWLVGSHLVVTGLHLVQDYVLGLAWPGTPLKPLEWPQALLHVRVSYMVLLGVAGMLVAHKVLRHWHQQRIVRQQLLQRKLHTELELLKAQLQPAFLFNTLATLHALTTARAPASPAAVLHFSALLRYLLYESQLPAVPLVDEAELLQHYLALEQLRLGPRVEVSLSFSGNLAAHTIAPLLLLPFVENAIRHGTAASQDCPWISIDLVAKKHSLTCKVIHSRPEAGPDPAAEPELRNVRERLARLYPGQHELKMVTEPDTFLVVVHLRRAPAEAVTTPPAPVLLSERAAVTF
ncbi:sensor histidine kinase [Hymenobacter metallicola]|nr:histidine kinase [Hymenobacter metallicola]